MPVKPQRIPNYRLHKLSGQARVIISGKHTYLGKFGTPESWKKYNRLIAALLNGQGPALLCSRSTNGSQSGLTVNELILGFWRHAQAYYRKNGEPTGEADNIRVSLRPLRTLYDSSPASDSGPDKLELVRVLVQRNVEF